MFKGSVGGDKINKRYWENRLSNLGFTDDRSNEIMMRCIIDYDENSLEYIIKAMKNDGWNVICNCKGLTEILAYREDSVD